MWWGCAVGTRTSTFIPEAFAANTRVQLKSAERGVFGVEDGGDGRPEIERLLVT
jgi:hypothetical protein